MLNFHSQIWEMCNRVWDDSLALLHNALLWMSIGWWWWCVCVRTYDKTLSHVAMFLYAWQHVYKTWLQFDSILAVSRIWDLIDLVLVTDRLTQASQTWPISRGFHALQCQLFTKNSAINRTSVAALWLKAFFMLEVREEWQSIKKEVWG